MDWIDRVLHYFNQETRFALHQRMDVLKGDLKWVQLSMSHLVTDCSKRRDDQEKLLHQLRQKIADLKLEMAENSLTKQQLDEQAAIQLDMDSIRVDFDKDYERLKDANAMLEEWLADARLALSKLLQERADLRGETHDLRSKLDLSKKEVTVWIKHFENMRDQRDEARNALALLNEGQS